MMRHVLKIEPSGVIRTVYSDTLPLARLGSLMVTRASTVEFNAPAQQWEVCWAERPDLVVFTHPSRDECIRWEVEKLHEQLYRTNS